MQIINNDQTSNNWQKILRDSFKNQTEFFKFLKVEAQSSINFPTHVPYAFAKRIKLAGPDSALWKQFVPHTLENQNLGNSDPIGDKINAKGNGIIHRYQSRVLFTPTTHCPVMCRYCFRKNELANKDQIFTSRLEKLLTYLKQNSQVNEVILTGGDPLILSNKKLDSIFQQLALIKLPFLRIHSRTPVIIPERIDSGFLQLLKSYQNQFKKITFVLHTNHQDEINKEVQGALLKLSDLNIQRLTQSVLLKDVNDHPQKLINLFYRIIDCDFVPYYLHHPDQVKGAMHFTLTVEEGKVIYSKLRDQLPGWAIPHYIVDHPKGKKLAVSL